MTTLTSPVTGAAISGLTSPSYTVTSVAAQAANQKSWNITALGGTQSGVDAHSLSRPFTFTMQHPKRPAVVGTVNAIAQTVSQVPVNSYVYRTRKGVTPVSGLSVNRISSAETTVNVPAGSELSDLVNLRAMLSCHVGCLTQIVDQIDDAIVAGSN